MIQVFPIFDVSEKTARLQHPAVGQDLLHRTAFRSISSEYCRDDHVRPVVGLPKHPVVETRTGDVDGAASGKSRVPGTAGRAPVRRPEVDVHGRQVFHDTVAYHGDAVACLTWASFALAVTAISPPDRVRTPREPLPWPACNPRRKPPTHTGPHRPRKLAGGPVATPRQSRPPAASAAR